MTDERDNAPYRPVDIIVRRLVNETSITEEQARELVAFIGYDWSSLMREARLLPKKR